MIHFSEHVPFITHGLDTLSEFQIFYIKTGREGVHRMKELLSTSDIFFPELMYSRPVERDKKSL
jgi:hypothetical protein